MKKYVRFILMIGLLLSLTLTLPLAAQEEAGVARVRIGYFAFDPRENDTYIDGELASFGPGWAWANWASPFPDPDYAWVRMDTVTPYFAVPSGVHSFAFVARGGNLDAAFLGPETVEFQPGHSYSLALMGHEELGDLKLLTVDETETFAGIDPEAYMWQTVAHNIAGAPPIEVTINGEKVVENLQYGQIVGFTSPVGFTTSIFSTVGDEPIRLFEFYDDSEKYNCEHNAMNGTYPGELGTEIFYDFGQAYPGELTIVNGGTVTIGDTLVGEVPAIMQRVGHALHLDSDASLNITVRATGMRTNDSTFQYGYFDPMFYVYDSNGGLLYWNDEQSHEDYTDDSGLEALALPAGDYTIQVSGYADLIGGPYSLVVESAANE